MKWIKKLVIERHQTKYSSGLWAPSRDPNWQRPVGRGSLFVSIQGRRSHLNPISIFYFWFHRSLRHLLSFNSPALISSAPSILGFHHQGSYLRSSSLCSSPMASISVPCPKASAIPRNAAALPRRASSPLAGFSQISLLKVSCSIPCCDLME